MLSSRRAFVFIAAFPPAMAGGNIAPQAFGNPQAPGNSRASEALDWDISPDGRQFEEYQICFSKGLQHSVNGYPERGPFDRFYKAIRERDINAFERVKLSVPWVDPTAGNQTSSAQVFRQKGGAWLGARGMLGGVAERYLGPFVRRFAFCCYGG